MIKIEFDQKIVLSYKIINKLNNLDSHFMRNRANSNISKKKKTIKS